MINKISNLVVVSLSNRVGGTEQCLQMLAEASSAQQIFILKANGNCLRPLKNEKVKFLTKGPMIFGFLILPIELFKYRRSHVILSSAVYLNAYLGFLKRIGYLKSEVIVRESTSIFTRFTGVKKATYKFAYRLGYPAIKLTICQTEIMRSNFIKHNHFIPEQKVLTVPNPINLKNIYKKACEKIVIEDGDFICAAGRLIAIKGFSNLIIAFKYLIDDGEDNLKLIILGEGPEKTNLVELIRKLNLGGKVILKGHVDNPLPYFQKARCCVVPSVQEGFPNVLLQMIALNDVVVTTLCAGDIDKIPAIVKVASDDPLALFNGIKLALKDDRLNNRTLLNNYIKIRTPENFLSKLKFAMI